MRIWRLADGLKVGALRGHEGWVQTVAVTPDGQHVVSGSLDRTVRLWAGDGVDPYAGHAVRAEDDERADSATDPAEPPAARDDEPPAAGDDEMVAEAGAVAETADDAPLQNGSCESSHDADAESALGLPQLLGRRARAAT